ncbi:ferritin [Anaerobacterium chartisolvens]|uniref:Ferritin n=1 Tax=Anaerobacterium chartisolvens TaxID=1297424 RepID=A0A369AQ22_9FIRM|nr:ferritin [Anaerobacterium chartisolvens]RCX10336.1 ferritin [Anaerobacterium chartisolvens]
MITERMQKELNDQVRKEFYSAYLYLSIGAYFTSINLEGFANWFRIQAQEERDHAMMFFDYINRVGGRVQLGAIDAPDFDFESIEQALRLTLEHEQLVTRSIYNIVDVAIEEKDHKTNQFLQWFVNEQTEEEASADANLKKVQLVGNDGRGILMLDGEMAQRVYTPPTAAV